MLDVAVGLKVDEWEASLFVANVSDTRAQSSMDTAPARRSYGVNTPHTAGLRLRKAF